jgi:hypothetical protein
MKSFQTGDLVTLDGLAEGYDGYVIEGGEGVVKVKFYADHRPATCSVDRLKHNHITREEHEERLRKVAVKYCYLGGGEWGVSRKGIS